MAARFAIRDLKGGLGSLRLCLICVALSVFMIVFVSALAQSVSGALKSQGRIILGGDLAFTLVHKNVGEKEKAWLEEWGALSTLALTRAMGRNESRDATLVEVKAVDRLYPLVGRFSSSAANGLQELSTGEALPGALLEKELLSRLRLRIGDRFLLGDGVFRIAGVIEEEPDRLSSGLGFGPRAIVGLNAADEAGLVRDGSLTRWVTRLRLQDPEKLQEALNGARREFPDAGWQIRTRDDSTPGLQRNVERFQNFLVVVGLLTLVIGGIGVSNAVRLFVEKRTRDFAISKALGATGSFMFMVASIEIFLTSSIGAFIGAAIGASLPYLLGTFVSEILGLPLETSVFPREIFLGVVIGILGGSAFSILPLGQVHDLSTTKILRSASDGLSPKLRLRYHVMMAATVGATVLAAFHLLDYSKIAISFLLAMVAYVLILNLLGQSIKRLAKRVPRPKSILVRFALSNLTRPKGLTVPVVVTFGLGLTILSLLMIVDHNLQNQFTRGFASKVPDLFLIDIPSRDADPIKRLIDQRAPKAAIDMTPMMRGRLVAINGAEIDRGRVGENAAWILEGDRGITFASTPPKNSRVIEGEWWSNEHKGEALVSLDAEIAKGLGVGLGDRITMNVMGRNVSAVISSLRRLEWSSMGINFVFVFSPNTFTGAPFMQLAAAHLTTDWETQQTIVRELSGQFPHIVTVQVKETIDRVSRIADQLRTAVFSLSLVIFASGLLVLGGALAANQETRLYEAAILVTLGARRKSVLVAFAIEFLALGIMAWGIALVLAIAAAWWILGRVMQLESIALPLAQLGGVGVVVILFVTACGLALTWRDLSGGIALRLRNR